MFNCGILLLIALVGLVAPGCSQEAKLARHLANANEYYASGSYDKAELEYKNVLQLSAQNSEALKRLGFIYADQGRLARADYFLSQARRRNTNDLEVRMRLANVFLGTGRNKEAREEALYVLGRSVEYPEASQVLALSANTTNLLLETRQRLQQIQQRVGDKGHLQVALGILWLRQKDFKAAETAFQKALALEPKSVEAMAGLSSVCWGLNDLAAAERYFKQAASLSPVRSGKALNYALFKLGTGAAPEARKMLDEIARQAPDYLPAQRILAALAIGDRKLDECSRIARGILTQEPTDYEAMLLLSRIKIAQGKPAEAIPLLTRLSGMYTNSAPAWYQLGVAYLANNEPVKGVPLLRQAIKLDTNLVEAVLVLAQQDIRRGDVATAITSLNQAIKRQPPVGAAYMLLANAYRVAGAPDQALAVYQQALGLFPKEPEPAVQMGFVLLSANRTDEARKAFEKAAEIAPNNFKVQEVLVNLELAENKFPAALQRVNLLREKDPQGVNPLLLLGRIFLAQTNYPQAEKALNQALALAPESRGAYLMLADIYDATHREQEALAKLQSGIAKNRNDWPALMMMASIQDRLKDFSAAAKSYEQALAVNATNLMIVNNLAYLYSERLNQPDKALQMAQKAQLLAPENPAVADTAGWILARRGEYARALVLLQESAEKLPAYPEAQYHLAMTHYMLGEEAPARLAFERALQSKQDFPGRAESERRLAFLKLDANAVDLKTLQDWEKRTADLPGNPSGDPVVLARLMLQRVSPFLTTYFVLFWGFFGCGFVLGEFDGFCPGNLENLSDGDGAALFDVVGAFDVLDAGTVGPGNSCQGIASFNPMIDNGPACAIFLSGQRVDPGDLGDPGRPGVSRQFGDRDFVEFREQQGILSLGNFQTVGGIGEEGRLMSGSQESFSRKAALPGQFLRRRWAGCPAGHSARKSPWIEEVDLYPDAAVSFREGSRRRPFADVRTGTHNIQDAFGDQEYPEVSLPPATSASFIVIKIRDRLCQGPQGPPPGPAFASSRTLQSQRLRGWLDRDHRAGHPRARRNVIGWKCCESGISGRGFSWLLVGGDADRPRYRRTHEKSKKQTRQQKAV